MLYNTFLHIQGIGPKTERALWRRGILNWDDFSRRPGPVFSKARDGFVDEELRLSREHRGDIRFFNRRLPSSESWRLFGEFKGRAAYLDIETSGGYGGVDEITVIGLYDGERVVSFVSGENLERFEETVCGYDLLITFNGTQFDLPFIRRSFPHICLPPAHIDLRFVLSRLGYRGGLKKIEKAVGIAREGRIEGMNGYDAVRLWQAHQNGYEGALERLLEYNRADIVNLEPLMQMAYRRMRAESVPGTRE